MGLSDEEIFGVKKAGTETTAPFSLGRGPKPGEPDARFNIHAYFNSSRKVGYECPPELAQEQPTSYSPCDDFIDTFRKITVGFPKLSPAQQYLVNRGSQTGVINHTHSPHDVEVVLGHEVTDDIGVLTALWAKPSPESVAQAAEYAAHRILYLAKDAHLMQSYEHMVRTAQVVSHDVNIGDQVPAFPGPRIIVSRHITMPRDILVVIV